jgi:hypothetical protein
LVRTIVATLVAVALILCGALESDAQIGGEVVDPSGVTLSRTTIRVLEAGSRKEVQRLRTGGDGRFEFHDLAPGRYLLSLSSSGFSPELVDVDTTKPGADVFRTLRMRTLDCDAPNVNCDCFSQCPVSEPHPVVAEASLKIGLEDAIDLDKAALVPLASPDSGLSLFEKDGGLYLNSIKGAVLLNQCKAPYGRGRQKAEAPPLRVDGLDKDTEVCMKTRRGRFSKIYLTKEVKSGDQQVLVYLVTRDK